MVVFRKILLSSAAALDIYRRNSGPLADRELADELANELDERRGLFFAEFSLIAGVLKKLLPCRP